MFAALLVLSASLAPAPAPTSSAEARVSVDLRDAEVADVLRLLAQLGDRQLVLDGGINCRLTLRLSGVPWETALEHSLRACGLASEMEGGVLRVATAARLIQEHQQRRDLEEARSRNGGPGLTRLPLTYARAEELAPLLQMLLGPGSEVTWDKRTNTLFIVSRQR